MQSSKASGLWAVVATLALAAGAAQAGFTSWDPVWVDTRPLSEQGWDWDAEAFTWDVWETFESGGTAVFGCSGSTGPDPTILVTKTVTNDSGFAWTSYEVEITGTGASYVPASAASPTYSTISEVGSTVTFSGATVNPGDVVELSFEINIPANTQFTFDVSQTPIPEPTSLGLLALGGLLLRRR